MMYFIHNYNNDKEKDVFEKIANYYIEFESIHPFEDGNGRTGKLLINFELLKNDIPPVVIPKEERVKYFEFLRDKDVLAFADRLRELSEEGGKRLNDITR